MNLDLTHEETTSAVSPGARHRRSGVEEYVAAKRERPTGAFAFLAGVGFVGMTVISAAGVMLGAPGPTGSSMERRVVSFAPSGTTGTALGTIALVLGLAAVGGAWIALGVLLR